MRAVVQRVLGASVAVDDRDVASIGLGFVALVGVGTQDGAEDAVYLAQKIAGLRVFRDGEDNMNLALPDVGGEVLAISQFTLYGDARKGRRPSFVDAAPGPAAQPLFDDFVRQLERLGVKVKTGIFGARMLVQLANDGPVTILLDSKKAF